MRPLHTDLILGLLCFIAGALSLFVWVPLDSDSGIVEMVRGRSNIGDAMAPSVASLLLGLAGLTLCFGARRSTADSGLSFANIRFLLILATILTVSFSLMRWTGPAVVAGLNLAGNDLPSYRELRDTAPWKYLGFLTGGSFLVSATIALVRKQLSWRTVLTGVCAAAVLALAYGESFDNLLLPPNGDV